MNRKIKFRGKNKYIGWVFGQLAYGLNGETYIIEEVELDNSYGLEETILYPVMWHRVDPETVGQFTGLYDNAKKEIYEGDIVKVNDEIIAEVIWENDYLGYFLYVNEENSIDSFENGEQPLYDYWGSIEVIGNIYDNPELLGGE